MRTIVEPPPAGDDPAVATGWWHDEPGTERIVCDLCPRACSMNPGDRGFCFVRQNVDGQMALTTYGKSTGFCIDPIEKKPLNHFYPGTAVLSFGTAGCNLGCRFCQNWDISKSREVERLSQQATPDTIAAAAKSSGCRSVAFTYNDPIIWAEYAIDTAKACRKEDVHSVAVTAGYISPAARPAFFHAMDAANVDLKSFSEEFYHKITYSHLQPVLDTLQWLKHESDVWFEVTNLLIPNANDSKDEIRQLCDWMLEAVGSDVPIHFTAFHPDFRMTDRDRTPHETLLQARQIAIDQGIQFAYVGNVNDVQNQSTWCPNCRELLIERNHYQLGAFHIVDGACGHWGHGIAGQFKNQPGTWGRKRQPIKISDHASQTVVPLNVPPKIIATPANAASVSPQRNPQMNPANPAAEAPSLTPEQEAAVHKAASAFVAASLDKGAIDDAPIRMLRSSGIHNLTVMGAFVTLKRKGRLRACCGMVGQPVPLGQAVQYSANRTATEDQRFPTISTTELRHLSLDVTLLSNFESVTSEGEDRVAAVEVGRHGLKVIRGDKAGLLLPSVAVEANWDARTFLDNVCRKAGLPMTAWQQPDTKLLRFEGHMIEGEFDDSVLPPHFGQPHFDMTQDQVNALRRFAHGNILAQIQGAIPGCLGADCPDRSVNGIVLRLQPADDSDGTTFSSFQMRPGIPLQTTLLQLTEAAARWLKSRGLHETACRSMQVDCVVFADPAMNGTIDSPTLEGVLPAERGVMVLEAQWRGWCFAAEQSIQEVMQTAAAAIKTRTQTASIYSFAVRSTVQNIADSNVPKPVTGSAIRPPAVAGKFYPADPNQLTQIVDECFATGATTQEQLPCLAAMVPHAGLRFSGRIAAGVLSRVKIPETVIIIGPKHARAGVNWAVAPHKSWQLPGVSMDADYDLAERLAGAIDGLESDAAAHADEHGIEVILPLLNKVAPAAKVVGIVMGAASLEQCQLFARQLADAIRDLPSMPLLLISSDMNHFATDAENRRLDELALKAMSTGDPAKLFHVVTSNRISMCGVIPAVIVMECLRQLGVASKIHHTGYATSAESGGTPDRVVGYAGTIFKTTGE